MKKRISGVTFGILFCGWVVSAVVGIGVMLGNCHAIVSPEGAQLSNDDDPFGTPPRRSTAAAWFALGLAMVVWPLPFGRGGSARIDGFGRE